MAHEVDKIVLIVTMIVDTYKKVVLVMNVYGVHVISTNYYIIV